MTHRITRLNRFSGAFVALAVFSVLSAVTHARAADKTQVKSPGLEHWIPDDVIGFVKVNKPAMVVRALLNSDLRKRAESTDLYKFLKEQEGARKAYKGLDTLKEATGRKLPELVEQVMGEESIVAARLTFPPSVLVLSRAKDAETIAKGVEALKSLVRHRFGNFPETQKSEHGGVTLETVDDKVSFAVRGDTFFASNSARAVRDMIDLAAGEGKKALAGSEIYAGCFEGENHVVAAVRPAFIPSFELPKKADNALASLLFSGWLETLRASDLVTAKVSGDLRRIGLSVGMRARPGELAVSIPSIFFESGGDSVAADLDHISKGGSVGLIHVNRDLATWWQKRELFLDERTAGEFLNANTFLSIFFGGISFQDEVLPAIENGFTLVSRRLEYDGLPSAPQPQIPGFAAIFRMKDPAKIADRVRSAFYQVVSIINLDRGQKNKGAAFNLTSEKVGDVDIAVAEVNAPKDGKPGIEHNFAPSVAVVGKRVVLSSNKELTRELVKELAADDGDGKGATKERAVDTIALTASELSSLLEANKDFLANTMVINDGISPDEARGRLHAIGELIGLFAGLDLKTSFQDGTATVDLGLSFAHGE